MVKIAVDAMGGDNAPGEIVAGAVMAAQSREDIQIFLIGKEEVVSEELKKHTYTKPVFRHCGICGPNESLFHRHAAAVPLFIVHSHITSIFTILEINL